MEKRQSKISLNDNWTHIKGQQNILDHLQVLKIIEDGCGDIMRLRSNWHCAVLKDYNGAVWFCKKFN